MLKISLWAHSGHTDIIKFMKKLLGIMVLGLFLYGCATPIGRDDNSHRTNNYVAITSMTPKSATKTFLTGASYGLYKPQLFDFIAYSDSKSEAITESEQKCKNYASEKGWTGKVHCKFNFVQSTGKQDRFAKSAYENASSKYKAKVISWDKKIVTYGYSEESIKSAVLMALANCYLVNNNCWVYEENGKEIVTSVSYNWNDVYHKILSTNEYIFIQNSDDSKNPQKITQVFKKKAGVNYKKVGNTTYASDGKSYRTVGNRTLGSDGSWARTLGSGSGSRTIYSDGTSSRTIGSGSGSRTIYSDGTSTRTIGTGIGKRTINPSTRTSCRTVGTRTICTNY